MLDRAYPEEFSNLLEVLSEFRLLEQHIRVGGGRKSAVAAMLDGHFYRLGWAEKAFDTAIMLDDETFKSPTHKVDCLKNQVAVEIEWNNKDPFFDRDLNNFRLLFDLRAIAVGVIVTRADELQELFDAIGRGESYGTSTTHMSKLLPRIEGGGGGGCPIVAFGIKKSLYVPSA